MEDLITRSSKVIMAKFKSSIWKHRKNCSKPSWAYNDLHVSIFIGSPSSSTLKQKTFSHSATCGSTTRRLASKESDFKLISIFLSLFHQRRLIQSDPKSRWCNPETGQKAFWDTDCGFCNCWHHPKSTISSFCFLLFLTWTGSVESDLRTKWWKQIHSPNPLMEFAEELSWNANW